MKFVRGAVDCEAKDTDENRLSHRPAERPLQRAEESRRTHEKCNEMRDLVRELEDIHLLDFRTRAGGEPKHRRRPKAYPKPRETSKPRRRICQQDEVHGNRPRDVGVTLLKLGGLAISARDGH